MMEMKDELPSAHEYLERWTSVRVNESLVAAWDDVNLWAGLDKSGSIFVEAVGTDDPRTGPEHGTLRDLFSVRRSFEEVLSEQDNDLSGTISALESMVERLKAWRDEGHTTTYSYASANS